MVKLSKEAQDFARRIGKNLGFALEQIDGVTDEQAEAAQRRLEKAVFHSIYSEGQFENALGEHRKMMRKLGEAINEELKEFRKAWRRYKKRGEHAGYANKRIAKSYFKQVIALEEEIDKHFRQFEKKLDVLSGWRQHKIENDIGAEVDISEVYEFIESEFDQFSIEETSIAEEESKEIIGAQRGSNGPVVSEEEEQLFDDFVEEEFGDEQESETATTESESMSEEFDAPGGDDESTRQRSDVDSEVRDFLEEELNN